MTKSLFLSKLYLDKYLSRAKIQKWGIRNFFGLTILNIVLMILILLHSAGYFSPYLPLSINLIVLAAIIFMSLLLETNRKALFLISLIFLSFPGLLKILAFVI